MNLISALFMDINKQFLLLSVKKQSSYYEFLML